MAQGVGGVGGGGIVVFPPRESFNRTTMTFGKSPTNLGCTHGVATLSVPRFTGLLPLPGIAVPRSGRHFGNTKTEKRLATQTTCRTDENTYRYSVPSDSKGRERIFLREKMKFLNRGITEKLR